MKKIIPTLLTTLLLSSCTISFNSNNITFGEYNYSKANKYIGASELVVEDNIETLHLYWVNGNVNISTSSDNSFTYKETCENDIEYTAFYYLNNDELTIHFVEDGTKNDEFQNLNKTIDISIPSSIEKIEIDNVNTNINLDEIDINEIEIDNVNGNININYLKCADLEFDIVNGNISIEKMNILDVDIQRVNGDLTIKEFVDSKEKIDLKIDSVNGEDILFIKENMGYTLDFSSVSKDFSSEYDNLFEYGDKLIRIDYSKVSGNLIIKKG